MDKKRKILLTALKLFATDGVAATSTRKIAETAAVSEGLIFKHYTNKNSLLEAIRNEAQEKRARLVAEVLEEDEPQTIIEKTIEIPFHIPKADYDFWRLELFLKWKEDANEAAKSSPLLYKISEAFELLGFEFPEYEAYSIYQTMEATTAEILRGRVKNMDTLKWFLTKKYTPRSSA